MRKQTAKVILEMENIFYFFWQVVFTLVLIVTSRPFLSFQV